MSTPPSMRTAMFAALLRDLRRARGLTQEELAARAGISVRSLGYLERGDADHAPRRDTLRLLIQALGLTEEEAARLRAAARPAATPAATPVSMPAPAEPPAHAIHADLPVPLTPLVGREHEEAAAVHLLTRDGTRLLTLTGPAGVGKTRLALQVATTLRDGHGWAVSYVGLIPVHEPERVLPYISQALGVPETSTQPPHEALVAAVRDQPLLLVLDNFEQVLAAAPALADLLGACPQLKLLVTSRAPLNIRGEQVFAVPPLALADVHAPPPVDQLEQVASVALFLERARAAAPDFALDPAQRDQQMAQVAAICRHLDGLPLAIELAAAQVRHFALDELAMRLGGAGALGILAGGPRDLAAHQRTMRSTIAWSYALLAPEEQRMCRVLSVFAGGATLDAIQAIADVDVEAALAHLSTVVDSGLARRSDHPLGSRYDQLVIVRAYAREQLRAAGEEADALRRHADYCLDLILRASASVTDESGSESGHLFDQVDAEFENARAALVWARDTGAVTHGLRMAGNLRRYWSTSFREGLRWIEYFIARAPNPTTPEECGVLAEAWTGVMVIAYRQDRFERSVEAGEIALALRRAQGDQRMIAGAMSNLANPLGMLHDFDRARTLYEECLAMLREMNDRRGMVFPLLNLGSLYYELGDMPKALALNEESIAISRELGENDWARTLTWVNIGEIYIVMDEPARALAIVEPINQWYLDRGDGFGMGLGGAILARAEWRLGAYDVARAHLETSARHYREVDNLAQAARSEYIRASLELDQGNLMAAHDNLERAIADLAGQPRAEQYLWWIVERAGSLAARHGRMERAAHLCAAGLAHRNALPSPVDPAERDLRARDQELLHAALDADALAAATTDGAALTLDAALALAREELAEAD